MLLSLEACDAVNIDESILITMVVLSKDYNLCTECAGQPDWPAHVLENNSTDGSSDVFMNTQNALPYPSAIPAL